MPQFEIDLFFLPSSAHNFYKYWWISIKFSGEVAEYHIHTMEMYIGPMVTYKYVLYGQKYAELGKIVWHFQSMIFLQLFFVCKFFTNIGKLYLKRKEISSSFQIWSQNWNICSSKKVIKENANICDFFCVSNLSKHAHLGPKLWL